ncbi:BTAD domain-containing putative transcriptional regulator [Micromonospora sp. NPDC047644]|uniref:AfsR/SARP family transcriptional regulator n=1 Tax=Micromonospora sp. NPDC047644 TaxID=3157203 RepID=UPI00345660D4
MPRSTSTSRTDRGAGHTTTENLHLEILGPLRFWRDGVEVNPGPQQQRLLLALLLARAGRPISTESLIDLIWGGDAPAAARNVIHKYVGALRRLMEPTLSTRDAGSYLRRHGNGYLLTAGTGMVVDLLAFRESTQAARVSLSAERREEALDHYVEALQLWRGSPGDALAYCPAATSVFAALDGELVDVCVVAAELAVTLGQPSRVLPALRLATSIAPLHEQVQASLIYTLAAAGQQAEALSVFQTVRARLAEDLGLDPGEGLQEAHRQVLSQAVTPAATVGLAGVPSALARTPLPRPAQLPPDLPIFVGRTEELATLSEWLGACDGARTGPLIVALDGMGGVGKSTLATRFAHQVAHRFVDGQLCLDLRGHDGESETVPAAEALRSLLSSQGVRVSSMPETLEALVGTWRSLTAGQRVLILLDNVQDFAQVRPLLPNSAESLVLVTSRKPLVGLAALDGAYLLHLDPPDMPTARALLRRRIERMPNRSAADLTAPGDALDEIIELCGRLPLALAILGGRLSARPRLSLPALAAELRDGTQRLASFPGGRGVRDPRAAFAWSYDQLSPEAARLFRLFSAALSPGISAEAGASLAGVPPLVARTLLAELADAALLDEDDRGHFTSHVLVKAYAQELFLAEESEGDRNAAVTRLLQHYLHSSQYAMAMLMPKGTLAVPPPAHGVVPERPRTYDEAVRWFDNEHETLHEAVRVAGELGSGIVPWQLALRMQAWLQRRGRFHDWQDVMRLSLRSARDSGDRAGEAHALRSLAGARHYFGAHQESLELLSDALRIFAESGMLLEQAVVHLNLHRTYTDLGRHECAIEHSDRALALYRTVGVEDAEIWTSETRGRSLVMLGATDQARQCLERALALAEKAGRKPDESEIRMSLARYLVQIGRQDDAVEQLDQARRVASETQNTLDVFQAEILLHDIRLSRDDKEGACRTWRNACDAMHAMQNGGTQSMRDAIVERGEKLNQIIEFHPGVRGTHRSARS